MTAPTPRPRNRGWIWYFIIVGLLTFAATVTLALFNMSLQLTADEWLAMRQLWEQHGPRDYDMRYTIKLDDQAQGKDFDVMVRAGKPVRAWEDDLEHGSARLSEFGMERFFDLMKNNLDRDSQPGAARVYTRARFQDETGAMLTYVRRVMKSRERLEISVKSFRYGHELKMAQ